MKGVEVLHFTELDSLSCVVLVKLPDLVIDLQCFVECFVICRQAMLEFS